MTRWEYLKLGAEGPNYIEELNRLGREGWELVSTCPPPVGGASVSRVTVFFFKRALYENT